MIRLKKIIGTILFLASFSGCHKQNEKPPLTTNGSETQLSEAKQVKEVTAIHTENWFQEITSQTGINFTFSSGRSAGEFAIIESLGGGLGAWDMDRDGQTDLMIAGGGTLDNKSVESRPCAFFRNLGQWKFIDNTAVANAQASEFFSHGIFHADWDNDGFGDVAISGYGGVQMLHNMGDGTFSRIESLISHPTHPWSSSLAWADFDKDGNLDLYVTHYVDWSWTKHPACAGQVVEREVCPPREFAGVSDAIYFSDGQGGFIRRDKEVGLVSEGKGLGVVAADIDLDNDMDIYVANDTVDNFLYVNDQGTFSESAVIAGVAGNESGVSTGSMGTLVFDANGDLLPDIWAVNFERELFALYRNEDNEAFSHVSRAFGLGSIGGSYVGFGTLALDFDLDGDLDLIVVNGHVSYASPYAPYKQRALLLENLDNSRFREVPSKGYFDTPHTSRGVVQADFNYDGLVDLAVSHQEEPVSILQGLAKAIPNGQLCLQLIGTQSPRDATGAVAFCENRLAMNNAGGSYLSQSEQRLWLTGLDDKALSHEVTIKWPSGHEQKLTISATNQAEWTIVEPRKTSP